MAKGLPHEEVWDDSALVTSWNEALEEYKKYHSLAAKGDKVNLVLDKAEEGQLDHNDLKATSTDSLGQPSQPSDDVTNGAVKAAKITEAGSTSLQSAPQHEVNTAAMPQVMLNNEQDEGLKNVKMSWYYAGYYTGFYEGQQKAYSSMQQQG